MKLLVRPLANSNSEKFQKFNSSSPSIVCSPENICSVIELNKGRVLELCDDDENVDVTYLVTEVTEFI